MLLFFKKLLLLLLLFKMVKYIIIKTYFRIVLNILTVLFSIVGLALISISQGLRLSSIKKSQPTNSTLFFLV